MKLIKNERGFIEPKDKKDQAIFEHCSGGMRAVTQERFDNHVKEILFLHDVWSIVYEWGDEE